MIENENHQLLNKKLALGFDCDTNIIGQLLRNPTGSIKGKICGTPCEFKIVSPYYVELISKHYVQQLIHDLNYYHDHLKIPVIFSHFGLNINFSEPTELYLHDEDMILSDAVKAFLKIFGAVIFRNVYLSSNVRDMGHRNRFPQLNFHVDRIPSQVSFYSVYTRNPFDEEQKQPRKSSTLFVPMLVAYLQGLTEGKTKLVSNEGLISNAILFDENNIKPLLNNIVVQHAWDQPLGTGEISIINNCNVLHSSYYPNVHDKGYRIGVRYLS